MSTTAAELYAAHKALEAAKPVSFPLTGAFACHQPGPSLLALVPPEQPRFGHVAVPVHQLRQRRRLAPHETRDLLYRLPSRDQRPHILDHGRVTHH